jgi:hypothetical protein
MGSDALADVVGFHAAHSATIIMLRNGGFRGPAFLLEGPVAESILS